MIDSGLSINIHININIHIEFYIFYHPIEKQPWGPARDFAPAVASAVQQRDASMDEFERKLLETMANARYRDKLRR